jgi:hypothetical protein
MITPHITTSKMWFSCWAAAAFQLRQAPVVVPDFAIGGGATPAHFLNMAALTAVRCPPDFERIAPRSRSVSEGIAEGWSSCIACCHHCPLWHTTENSAQEQARSQKSLPPKIATVQ